MKFERLGEVVKIAKGKKHEPAPKKEGRNFRYIQIDDLRNDNNLKYTDEKGTEVNENDLIIAWDGANAGTIGFGLRGMIGSTLARLRIKKEKEYSTEFIGYLLRSQNKFLRSKTTGATIPHISKNALESIKIPRLDYPEQYSAALVLKKSEALIEQRKQSILLLDEFLKSNYNEMFGEPVRNAKKWELKKLENISDIGSSKRVFVEELVESGIPFFRGTEIGKLAEGIQIIPTLHITQQHFEQLKSHTGVPKIGDLLMPSICPDGRIFRVTNDNAFYFKDGRVLWIQPNQSLINSIYLHYTLKRIFITNYNKIASGTTFAELKIVALKKIILPLPPIELQTQFAYIVSKAEALKEEYKNSLVELENLYGSLSQKAFKGELKFNNPLLPPFVRH